MLLSNLTAIIIPLFLSKIHLVMKTELFKLLNQTIIPCYATNHNIKFQTRLKVPPFLNTNFFIPLI
ncbi:hypothetical protein C2R51_02375 [Helicobacter pylori]|nr:hypothetical protein C2R51_02375 [Helicobacter pylori]